jgi:hypothetical protein
VTVMSWGSMAVRGAVLVSAGTVVPMGGSADVVFPLRWLTCRSRSDQVPYTEYGCTGSEHPENRSTRHDRY